MSTLDIAYVLALLALLAALLALLAFVVRQGGGSEQRHMPWLAAARHILDEPPGRAFDLPVEILPYLLLGDKRSAGDPHALEAFGVTHVLNVAGRYGKTELASSCCYLEIAADDEEGYPLLKRHFVEASAFMNRARVEGGRCLVHCQAGVNRSACLAVAELMLSQQLPVLDALRRAKQARGVLLSNHSFQAQLIELAHANNLLGSRPADAPSVASQRKPRRSAAEALRALG